MSHVWDVHPGETFLANFVKVALVPSQPGVKRLKIWLWVPIKLSGSAQGKHSKEKCVVFLNRENKICFCLNYSDESRDLGSVGWFWMSYFLMLAITNSCSLASFFKLFLYAGIIGIW